MSTIYRDDYKSPLGDMIILSSDKGVCCLTWGTGSQGHMAEFVGKHFPDAEIEYGGKHNKKAISELKAYFAGKLKKFTVKLDIQASGFYHKCLERVNKIPLGKTKTYGEIAAEAGNPRASRAAGSANRTNNIPIIIPCHRVVASNGLGGYGANPGMKLRLLQHEGIDVRTRFGKSVARI